MIRTQVQLTKEQYELLRELSHSRGESVAAIVRQAIEQFLLSRKPDRASLYRQALSVVGKYQAGAGDVSLEHDRYLEEAYGS
jgi:predicted DNA-binding protein